MSVIREDAFRPIADGLPQIIWAVSPSGEIEWVNSAWLRATGLPLEGDQDAIWRQAIHPDDYASVFSGWSAAFDRGVPYEFEYRVRMRDGRYRWHLAHSTPFRDESGKIVRWYGVSTDFDDVRLADASFGTVVDAFPQIVWVADAATGRVLRVNKRMLSYTGLSTDDLLGTGWVSIVHPDDLQIAIDARDRGESSGEAVEWTYRLRRADGMYRRHLSRVAPIRSSAGEIVQWVATCTDVDDEYRDHEALRLLSDTVPQFLFSSRPDGTVDYVNAQFKAYTGFDATSEPFRWEQVVHPDDMPAMNVFWDGLQPADESPEIEIRLRRYDGTYRWFLSRLRANVDRDGRVLQWISSATDVNDRKRAADALAYLDEANDILAGARDLDRALGIAAQLAVPRVADWCAIYLRQADTFFRPAAIHHADPEKVELARELVRRYPFSDESIGAMLETRQPTFLADITPEILELGAKDARHAQMLLQLDLASAIIVPMIAEDETIGMLHLVRGRNNDRFTLADVDFAQVLAKRIAIAIGNVLSFERERNVARTFQSAALPRSLPIVPGIDLDTVYVTGERSAEIGGDWYDAVSLPDGSLLFSIGDVSGKGLEAAVLMGSVRQAIRVAGLQMFTPAKILAVAQTALMAEQPGRFVTAFVGCITPDRHRLIYASAGHPPPVLRDKSGTRFLALGGLPLGVDAGDLQDHESALDGSWLIAAYTDGLIEVSGDVIAGEQLVRELVASDGIVRSTQPAEFIRERVLRGGVRDDTAILTLRRDVDDHWRFRSNDALRAEQTRARVMQWLSVRATGDLAAAELIYGELVGNVVRHAPGSIDIDIEQSGNAFSLSVQDSGLNAVSLTGLPDDIMSENGRGLFIVNELAEKFACRPLPVFGNQIEVTLPLRPRTER